MSDQPVGYPVPGWAPLPRPGRVTLTGRLVTVEPLSAGRHGPALHAAFGADPPLWTYMPYGPFPDEAAFLAWAEVAERSDDPLFFAVVDRGRPVGVAAYLRITPAAGSIEVGSITYAPSLQRTAGATEAMYLMMRQAFELGYRRYEWKCDVLNAPSRLAAERLGFTFEGVFRSHMVYKGRNRDTAWYSVIDSEWPALDGRFRRWLDPANFDDTGRQRRRLVDS